MENNQQFEEQLKAFDMDQVDDLLVKFQELIEKGIATKVSVYKEEEELFSVPAFALASFIIPWVRKIGAVGFVSLLLIGYKIEVVTGGGKKIITIDPQKISTAIKDFIEELK